MHDIWKWIPGYESEYEVSSGGDVRSVDRIVMRRGFPAKLSGRPLSACLRKDGRRSVSLSSDGTVQVCLVSVLVCIAFHGPRPPGMMCCHNNGNPADDRATNLRWDTPSANQRDRERHGTCLRGERNPASKLQRTDVMAIKDAARCGASPASLAKHYSVTPGAIYQILRRETWRHLP